jgi:hypothetical protein
MCSPATSQILCPIIDIKKSDENNRETLASVTNADGEDEPITFGNIHRYIVKKTLIQGNYVTELSITKAGFSFTTKCNNMSVSINNSNNKEVVMAPPLWIPKSNKKAVTHDFDDESTDGAFDPIPHHTPYEEFGISANGGDFDLNAAFCDNASDNSGSDNAGDNAGGDNDNAGDNDEP